jgi:hypothetical protein
MEKVATLASRVGEAHGFTPIEMDTVGCMASNASEIYVNRFRCAPAPFWVMVDFGTPCLDYI